MKYIPLTKGKVALVDDQDACHLVSWAWRLLKSPHQTHGYAVRTIEVNGTRKPLKMEHAIMGAPPRGFIWDHRNGFSLDNRRCNLRLASTSQNNRNRRKHKGGCAYLGVYWDR